VEATLAKYSSPAEVAALEAEYAAKLAVAEQKIMELLAKIMDLVRPGGGGEDKSALAAAMAKVVALEVQMAYMYTEEDLKVRIYSMCDQ
jgi:hypothetical protein